MAADSSDEVLVQQAQAGNREAFLILYNRYLNKVHNRVKSRVPLRDAEDVTQEIFIAVVRSLDNFEHRARFSTWLYTITNRQIADYYRRSYRRKEDQVIWLDADNGLDIKVDHAIDLDDKLDMQQALQALPENYQEVILLRFADGFTFAEIAEARQQTLEATKSLYRRAIAALSKKAHRKTRELPGSESG